jgi:hypothetical protein
MSKITELVKKLLAQAEGTPFEKERDTFLAKARELIEKHQIDAQLLGQADPSKREGVIRHRMFNDAKGQRLIKAKREMIQYLADVYGCQTIRHGANGRAGLTLVGHESDVELILMMFNSLMLQLMTALAAAQNAGEVVGASGPVSYAHGWVRRVGTRLLSAKADAAATAGPMSQALVLVDRSAMVQAQVEEWWPKLRTRKQATSVNDYTAYGAGSRDGNRADLGGTRLTGEAGRKAIN